MINVSISNACGDPIMCPMGRVILVVIYKSNNIGLVGSKVRVWDLKGSLGVLNERNRINGVATHWLDSYIRKTGNVAIGQWSARDRLKFAMLGIHYYIVGEIN